MFHHSASLTENLEKAFKNLGPEYKPRTRHLDNKEKPVYINRLILEDSPYLLQHAHNPIDWFPWGEEAFDEARKTNKPVFLSIGYSTCHWCHVMEEESFDNEKIAAVMNEHFICIKVDRELHPDVDSYYMTAVMMMQGHGGWPMSSFLTADRQPFFGGTYFQPEQFVSLLSRVRELWLNQHDDLLEQALHFSQQIAGTMAAKQSLNEIGTNVVDLTAQSLMNHHDPEHGGFGQTPKFPNEPYLYFLLDYATFKGDKHIFDAMIRTLHIQSCGGIYDHIGGGFHRYATDSNWLVPHFEKMLYNQANLSYLFAQAWVLSGAKDFKRVSTKTLDYVLREMSCPGGGFYSATDADSEGEEGLFFIWDKAEVQTILGAEADEFIQLYQITEAGNFEGQNIPNLLMPLEQYADKNNINYDELIVRLEKSKTRLLEERAKRVKPLRDEKIITAWNGMMIKAFAYAGKVFKRQDYIEAARRAADYVLSNNINKASALCRSSLNGSASVHALQEDYAYLAEALLQLYDVTREKKWLGHAAQLTNDMLERFWDEESGGFFMSRQAVNNLLPSTPKDIQDNATASGNSVALKLLVRLWRRDGSQTYQKYAQQLIRSFSDDITQRPYVSAYLIDGLMELLVGEQGSSQWCCEGKLLLNLKTNHGDEALLTVDIAEDWYLNAIETNNNLVPLLIESDSNWSISDVFYPQAIEKQLAYQDTPVYIYTGKLEIKIKILLKNNGTVSFPDNLLKLKLRLQACNNERCLTAEKTHLTLFM